jgi:hypothetical protein
MLPFETHRSVRSEETVILEHLCSNKMLHSAFQSCVLLGLPKKELRLLEFERNVLLP